jgi:hypothetical protein
MKRRIVCALLIFISILALAAEDQPQIGYRILSGYLTKKEADGDRGRKGVGIGFATTGGLLIAGAATTYFAGDWIGESLFSGAMDPEIKTNVSLGLGIGGLAASAIGAGILAAKPRDWTLEYAEVFAETDQQVREALAVAALKDLAIKGKKERMTGAISNLAVPIVFGAARASINIAKGKAWYMDILDGIYWSPWSVVSGLTSLFGTSEEERLYEKYLAGRDALYGDRADSTSR